MTKSSVTCSRTQHRDIWICPEKPFVIEIQKTVRRLLDAQLFSLGKIRYRMSSEAKAKLQHE
jgi:hypothetical protein